VPFCKNFFFKYFWWYLLFCEENINYRKVEIFQETFFGSYSFIHPDSWNFLTCSHKFGRPKSDWITDLVSVCPFYCLFRRSDWEHGHNFLCPCISFYFFLNISLYSILLSIDFCFAFSFLILWSPYKKKNTSDRK